jgi:hypothetical protein
MSKVSASSSDSSSSAAQVILHDNDQNTVMSFKLLPTHHVLFLPCLCPLATVAHMLLTDCVDGQQTALPPPFITLLYCWLEGNTSFFPEHLQPQFTSLPSDPSQLLPTRDSITFWTDLCHFLAHWQPDPAFAPRAPPVPTRPTPRHRCQPASQKCCCPTPRSSPTPPRPKR